MGEDSETTKTSVATRLSGDTLDELETYCEEQDVSKAWAIRHFTKEGLNRAKIQGELGGDRLSRAKMSGRLLDFVVYGTFTVLLIVALAEFGVI